MMTTKKIFALSAGFSVAFAAAAYLIFAFILPEDALKLALFCGLILYVLLAVYMLIHSAVVGKRYEKAEKNITSPVLYKANGNFQLGEDGKVANGNIYFCDDMVVFAALESKPYAAEGLCYDEIEGVSCDELHFTFYAKNGRVYFITVPNAPEIAKILEEKGLLTRAE